MQYFIIADHVYLSAMTIHCGCVSAINSLALALSLAIWKAPLKIPYYILYISAARRHFLSKCVYGEYIIHPVLSSDLSTPSKCMFMPM